MITTPFNFAVTATKSDTANIAGPKPLTDALYVGGAGVVAAVFQDGTTCDITATAGVTLPIAIKRVNSTNTTATVMTALYAL